MLDQILAICNQKDIFLYVDYSGENDRLDLEFNWESQFQLFSSTGSTKDKVLADALKWLETNP